MMYIYISRVSDCNGVFLLYIMLEIHHSVREPSISNSNTKVQQPVSISWLILLFQLETARSVQHFSSNEIPRERTLHNLP